MTGKIFDTYHISKTRNTASKDVQFTTDQNSCSYNFQPFWS